jgi:hypothetical protein
VSKDNHLRRKKSACLDRNIHPPSDFKRSAPKGLEQSRETGGPVALTVNGRAALVVMDTKSCQEILDRPAYAGELAAISYLA